MAFDIEKLFSVTMQGLELTQKLAQQGSDISGALKPLMNVFSKLPDQVTDAELDEVEEGLDEDLDDFEKPLKRQV